MVGPSVKRAATEKQMKIAYDDPYIVISTETWPNVNFTCIYVKKMEI